MLQVFSKEITCCPTCKYYFAPIFTTDSANFPDPFLNPNTHILEKDKIKKALNIDDECQFCLIRRKQILTKDLLTHNPKFKLPFWELIKEGIPVSIQTDEEIDAYPPVKRFFMKISKFFKRLGVAVLQAMNNLCKETFITGILNFASFLEKYKGTLFKGLIIKPIVIPRNVRIISENSLHHPLEESKGRVLNQSPKYLSSPKHLSEAPMMNSYSPREGFQGARADIIGGREFMEEERGYLGNRGLLTRGRSEMVDNANERERIQDKLNENVLKLTKQLKKNKAKTNNQEKINVAEEMKAGQPLPEGQLPEQPRPRGKVEKSKEFAEMLDVLWWTSLRFFLILVGIAFLLYITWSVYNDIQLGISKKKSAIVIEIEQCQREYTQNHCSIPEKVTYMMKEGCERLQKCVDRNIDDEAQTTVQLMHMIAELINDFFDKLSLHAAFLLFIFIVLPLSVWLCVSTSATKKYQHTRQNDMFTDNLMNKGYTLSIQPPEKKGKKDKEEKVYNQMLLGPQNEKVDVKIKKKKS